MPDDTATAEGVTLEQIAGQLGPFAPPVDYAFEDELSGPGPREVPARLRQGYGARSRRAAGEALLAVGAVLVLLDWTGWVDNLAYYLLPLQYLNWIALGLVALGVLILARQGRPANAEYVVRGEPSVGRLLAALPAKLGAQVGVGYLFLYQYRNPETGQLAFGEMVTDPLGSDASQLATPLEPGEYFTVVGLPGKYGETVRIYGLLNLSPDHHFVTRGGKPIEPWSTRAVIATSLGLAVVFCALLSSIALLHVPVAGYAILGWVLGAGAALGLLIAVAIQVWSRRDPPRRGKELVGLYFVSIVGAAMFAAFGAMGVNATFDRSPARYVDIEVVEYWQETWNFIYRNYQIEYRELVSGRSEKQMAPIEVMERFQQTGLGVLDMRAGALGMPWVRGIHPLVLDIAEPEDEGGAATVFVGIELPDGGRIEPSDALFERLMEQTR